jgi:hypothetical protein
MLKGLLEASSPRRRYGERRLDLRHQCPLVGSEHII